MLLTLLACAPNLAPTPAPPPQPPPPPLLDFAEVRTAGAGDNAPLIVALHGLGDSPAGFQGLFERFPAPARFLLPAGPEPRGDGFSWYPYPAADDEALAAGLAASADRVAQLIAAHGGSAVVTGFSQGGMLSFALAAQHPEVIVAAVPISGTLPAQLWPEGAPDGIELPPVTALHGDADDRIPIGPAQDATAALAARGHDALMVPYAGVEHTISQAMRLDLYLTLAESIGAPLPPRSTCPLLTPQPEGLSLTVPLGEAALPVGSLVRPAPQQCGDQVAAEVVSINPLIRLPNQGQRLAEVGEVGCIDRELLTDLGGQVLLPHPPMPGVDNPFPADARISGPLSTACGSNRYGRLSVADLAHLRPATADMVAAVDAVRAAWPSELGEAPGVGVSRWGYVRLPLPGPLTDDEIAAEWAREHLETDAQREKATTALGPVVDGEPLYTHFTGADARYSDAWGRPEVVAALVELAAGWRVACRAAGWTGAQCTLQIGDLAWYNARRPDPLGHEEHFAGGCVDLRLFRSDGSRYESYWNQTDDRIQAEGGYSAPITRAFLQYAIDNHPVEDIFYNDPEIRLNGVVPKKGHDDHIHLCLSP